jgi:PqqD family protein of HPr-rel-A system
MDSTGDHRVREDHDDLSGRQAPVLVDRAALTRVSLWRVASPQAIAWREFADELVIYDDATGDTHHLGELGGHVLLTLLRHSSGVDMSALVREILDGAGITDKALLAEQIERTLLELAKLRLVAFSFD